MDAAVQPPVCPSGGAGGEARDRGLRVHEARARRAARRAAEARIRVVPNGVGEVVLARRARGRDGDYVLAVGTLEPRKNLGAARGGGAAARGRAPRRRRAGLGRRRAGPGVRRLGRVSDDELARLYRGARCLAYPSLYEGFGIPIARGDGVRHAGRDERGRCDGGGRPAAPRCSSIRSTGRDRRRDRGGGSPVATSCVPRPRARPRVQLGRRPRAATAERLPRGGGVTVPLVVVDADVLGRQRTGDETYVENLLRHLPGAGRRRSSASPR